MRTRLRLYLEWGITFGKPYILPECAARKVAYADKVSLIRRIRSASTADSETQQHDSAYQVGRKGAVP